MQIKTKYNVGDTFYILTNKIKKCKVSLIEVRVYGDNADIKYGYRDGCLATFWAKECEAFSSSEEVINHLKKENNVRD